MISMYTIDAIIEERGRKHPDTIALYRGECTDAPIPVTAAEFCSQKRALAAAFEKIGLTNGDTVGIISAVRYEWELCDKAAVSIGCATFGIDTRHTKQEIASEIDVASIDALIVEHGDLLANIPASFTKPIICIEATDTTHRAHLYTLSHLLEEHKGQTPVQHGMPDDYAVIISTSGTTGTPKLIRYRQRQMVAACLSVVEFLDFENQDKNSISLCWLPLVYMTSKMLNLTTYAAGGSLYFLSNPKQIRDAILKVNPTHFLSVPIFYERLYKSLEERFLELPLLKRIYIRTVLAIRRYAHIPVAPFAIRTIRNQIFGTQFRYAISGSAPLSPDLIEYFSALSIPIHLAYALSENASIVSMNTPWAHKTGSVGKILPRLTVRIASDGEILVKGEAVFEGYLGYEMEKDEHIDANGYLRTGDIGFIDEDGFLFITGRKKNIIKTANGYRISPSEIEAVLETSPYISQIVVVGDQREYLGALIVLEVGEIDRYVQEHALTISRKEYASSDIIRALIAKEIADVGKHLAIYKQPRVFTLYTEPFSIANNEMTGNLKIRRTVVIDHHKKDIEAMYSKKI